MFFVLIDIKCEMIQLIYNIMFESEQYCSALNDIFFNNIVKGSEMLGNRAFQKSGTEFGSFNKKFNICF